MDITDLKDTKVGQTAFILGTAPSLKELDLQYFMDKETFWVNKAYLCAADACIEFKPKYYVISDPNEFRTRKEDILNVDAEYKFFRSDVLAQFNNVDPKADKSDIISFKKIREPFMHQGHFQTDMKRGAYRGYTVVLDALQIAYHMGFSTVLVGGVDLDYMQEVGPYSFSKNGKEPPRVFMPIERVRKGFRYAKEVFDKNGRKLYKITTSPNLPLPFLEHNS